MTGTTIAGRAQPGHPDEQVLDDELREAVTQLGSADNFRDVGGPAAPYRTSDGRELRRGVAYRSNGLRISDTEAASIGNLGIGVVYDLRTEHEVRARPDVPVPGARWHHLEVKGIPLSRIDDVNDVASAVKVMSDVYRGFVDVPGARAAYAELFRAIADSEAGILFHCAAGKDRTGWAAAMLLHLAGVDDQTILEDYLLTNTVAAGSREKFIGLIADRHGDEKAEVYRYVMLADQTYLHAGYDAVEAAYGDRVSYLRNGLGLDDATLERLRERLVV